MTYYGTRLSDNISRREPEGERSECQPGGLSAKQKRTERVIRNKSLSVEDKRRRLRMRASGSRKR